MPPRQATPTILDVAAAAGVSVTTVSRVLNGKGDVAPATGARVRAVIAELGYESSLAARSLRGRRSHVVGLIVPDMDHSYMVEIIRGVGRAITGTDYDLIALTTGSKSHEERGRWEQRQVARLNGAIADGMIVVTPDAREFRTAFPLVTVDPYLHTALYPTVTGDNRQGTRAAIEHLIGLGHQRIGYIGGGDFLDSAEQRRLGYDEALQEAGIPLDPALVMAGDFTYEGGFDGAQRLLSLEQPPTAIFAGNDDAARGVLDLAHELGVRVPEELSVVGFDNVPGAQLCRPPLTTVDQQIKLIGEIAVQMLLDQIEGKALEQTLVKAPTTLVVRASTAPPPSAERVGLAVQHPLQRTP